MSAVSPGGPAEDSSARNTGPGHLLRTARESTGISVREVSTQLRLDERTVIALESDDFKDLPAPTFVRGYLRGYARLLGVPVGPVMEAYDREGFNPPDLVADIAETPDASTRDIPVRLASIGVVVVLVVLVVMWWNNQAFNDLPDAVPESGNEPAPVDPLAPGAVSSESSNDRSAAMQGGAGSRDESEGDSAQDAPASSGEPSRELTAAASDASGTGSGDAAASSTTQATIQAGTTPATSSGADTADRVIARAQGVLERTRSEVNAIVSNAGAAASESPPSTDASTTQATAQPANNPAPATAGASASSEGGNTGPARLVMSFPIEAWVEVYDGNNERMYYNLAKPGRVVDVTGEPPIRVLLGRTRGVTVTFNGKAVDLAPFTERGVARLTLGQ